MYSTHRAANAVGAFVGPLVAGLLAYPVRVAVAVRGVRRADARVRASRPPAPRTGARALGAAAEGRHADVVMTEETAAVVRRELAHGAAVPTPAAAVGVAPVPRRRLVGFVALGALLYEQEFDLDERARGRRAAIAEPFQLVGLVVGAGSRRAGTPPTSPA